MISGSARTAAALAVVVSMLLAGCGGTLVEYAATPATIPDSALEPAGYVHGNTTAVPLAYPIGVGPASVDARATVWVSGYSKTVDEEVAGVVVVSAPNERIGGVSVNPAVYLTNRELVGWALDRVQDGQAIAGVPEVSGISEVASRETTILDQTVELVTYAGTAEVDGERAAFLFHLAVVEHGDDVVVVLGFHPEAFDESEGIAALVERVEHAT